MGVPAFYRWLSEKYPKIVQDVLEERVPYHEGTVYVPFDATRPNPSGLECDNLYIDMNGIIHPCSHPENGPQPKTEEEMFENVCRYVDRLFRALRPRKLLYLAIDGVAPRAKMNQQRARRFRAAQEARELKELEQQVAVTIQEDGDSDSEDNDNTNGNQEAVNRKQHATNLLQEDNNNNNDGGGGAWDSNVITPGTPFMVRLATFLRFYIRKRLSHDKAWKPLKVLFSDASIPGEGEHKIMAHVRLQRSQVGYNPNTVHILHGLDADLIMLALATHEAHFYISREQVLFGRKSIEMMEQRQEESGFRLQQQMFDEAAGGEKALQLPENGYGKPLERISIPILREYLTAEFQHDCLNPESLPFRPNLERLLDDIVFMCFFVGNDFLPHLPSLDIRDGALDFLFNVYKRILPTTLGDYITKSGGNVHLPAVSVLLQEVGAIEDYVFAMKHDKEQQMKQRQEQFKKNNNKNNNKNGPPLTSSTEPKAENFPLEHKRLAQLASSKKQKNHNNTNGDESMQWQALDRGHAAKERARQQTKAASAATKKTVTPASDPDNWQAAQAVKEALQMASSSSAAAAVESKEPNGGSSSSHKNNETTTTTILKVEETTEMSSSRSSEKKRKQNDSIMDATTTTTTTTKEDNVLGQSSNKKAKTTKATTKAVGTVGEMEDEFETGENDEDDDDDDDDVVLDDTMDTTLSSTPSSNRQVRPLVASTDPAAMAAAAASFKEKVKAAQQRKLDEYANNVQDNVRLHEAGWKERYYTDKCKADDVAAHGGREHLFRSYVVGLCWVMKYYYDGCPSWKWYFPFHYAPFASDLVNVERFQPDVRALELSQPFHPVEQLMAVLPSDSAHAVPKASRWLMCDPESPIIDFYPTNVPVDPNGKAMPWLWVVLLPFIDEERLLDAMTPTMAQWTKEELLCNAHGLDDGYLYVHKSHALTTKLATVLRKGKTAKDPRIRLGNAAAYGAPGFSGSIRAPLSNELYPVDQNGDDGSDKDGMAAMVTIKRPPTADQIENPGPDGLFTEDLHGNAAVCVAFSEPAKLPHRSLLLPGARPLPPVLTEQDKRIRRPRLGRGGSIANMGGGGSLNQNNNSHQAGYGSMNVSSYERDLAQRNGRGKELYQTGMRSWGAMEPTPKFHRHPPPPPPPPSNPFLAAQQQQHPSSFHPQQQQLRYPQQQQQPPYPYSNNNPTGRGPGPWSQQGGGGRGRGPPQSRGGGGYSNHPGRGGGRMPPQQQQPQTAYHRTRPGASFPQPAAARGGGFSFRNQFHGSAAAASTAPHHNHHHSRPPQHRQEYQYQQQQHPPSQQQQPQRSRASSNAMQNLRAQLSSTLMRQRHHNNNNNNNNNAKRS